MAHLKEIVRPFSFRKSTLSSCHSNCLIFVLFAFGLQSSHVLLIDSITELAFGDDGKQCPFTFEVEIFTLELFWL